ncbi:MAG: amino acid ABC transporter permease [bacterium]|nr:amino acid ABC transporter permease [bacterium]
MERIFDVKYLISALPHVISGIPVSLSIAVVAFFFGTMLGFIGAMAKIYKIPVLRQITVAYVSFVRGTPLVAQIFLIYYGIPVILKIVNEKMGTNLNVSGIPAILFIFIAFSLNAGAYLTETIRSAILSVEKGQMEAAYSVGMTPTQTMLRIILPQALKLGLPNISNFFIGLLKDTSLAFVAAVPDIMGEAKIVAGRTSRFFEAYIDAAVIFWMICVAFELLIHVAENHTRRNEKGVVS